jgi:protein tyrosine phosphatase (PTP) superfamily phosphohydrolase (DUF442 family)
MAAWRGKELLADRAGEDRLAASAPTTSAEKLPARPHAKTWLIRGLLLGSALGGLLFPWHLLGDNFHTVLPGQVYRSAQLSPAGLQARIAECHLRSVVNLRGANPGEVWYDEECELAAQEGVQHYDLAPDSEAPPTPAELEQMIRIFDRCPRPLLIHCQSGINRTGLVAAICVLLADEGTLALAHEQLRLPYGLLSWGSGTARQEAFLTEYETWLARHAYLHSPARFRYWAQHIYGQHIVNTACSGNDRAAGSSPEHSE